MLLKGLKATRRPTTIQRGTNVTVSASQSEPEGQSMAKAPIYVPEGPWQVVSVLYVEYSFEQDHLNH